GLGRQADHCNRFVFLENFFDAHCNTRSSAARKRSFCSRVPTDTRIHFGAPQAGRTMTPCLSSADVTSLAGRPRSTSTKLVNEGTYLTPHFESPWYRKSRSFRFSVTLFSTCALSSHAASAATCATLLVLNAMRTL